jgi:hypothetical protein
MTGTQETSKGRWEEGAGIMTFILLFHTQYANQEEQWQPKHGGPGNEQATPQWQLTPGLYCQAICASDGIWREPPCWRMSCWSWPWGGVHHELGCSSQKWVNPVAGYPASLRWGSGFEALCATIGRERSLLCPEAFPSSCPCTMASDEAITGLVWKSHNCTAREPPGGSEQTNGNKYEGCPTAKECTGWRHWFNFQKQYLSRWLNIVKGRTTLMQMCSPEDPTGGEALIVRKLTVR